MFNRALPDKEYKKFLKLIYLFKFFRNLSFIYPLYAIMFAENGISQPQISLLFIMWSVSAMFFVLPIGAFADNHSRKRIVIAGEAFDMLGLLCWIYINNFYGYLLGFIFQSVTWITGSAVFEAFLYDMLKKFRREGEYSKVCGRLESITLISYATSAGGSFLLFLGYDTIMYLGILSVFISALCLCFTPKVSQRRRMQHTNLAKSIKTGFKILRQRTKAVAILIIFTIVVGAALIDEYFGLIGLEIGMEEKYVGLIYIYAFLFNILGSYNAHHFQHMNSRKQLYTIALVGILYMSIFFFYNITAVFIIGIAFFVIGVITNLMLLNYQRAIPSSSRALMMSFYSFAEQITTIGSYFAMMGGFLLGNYSFGFLILGFVLALTAFIYLIAKVNIKA